MSIRTLLLLTPAALLASLYFWYTDTDPIISSRGWDWEVAADNLPEVAGIWQEADGSLLVTQDGPRQQCQLLHIGTDDSRTVILDNLSEPDAVQRHAMGLIVSEEQGDLGASLVVGNTKHQLVSLNNAEGFTVSPDGQYLLVAEDCDDCRIMRVDLHSGEQLALASNLANPEGVCMLGDTVYFTEKGRGKFWRVGLNGGKPELLSDTLKHPSSLACDNQQQVVWIGEESVSFGRIQRYSNGQYEIVARLLGEPQEIHIIEGGILVAEMRRARILRITRTGTVAQTPPADRVVSTHSRVTTTSSATLPYNVLTRNP